MTSSKSCATRETLYQENRCMKSTRFSKSKFKVVVSLVLVVAACVLNISLSFTSDSTNESTFHLEVQETTTSKKETKQKQREQEDDEIANVNVIPVFYNLFLDKEEDRPRVKKLLVEQLAYLNPYWHNPVYINSIKLSWNLTDLEETANQLIRLKAPETPPPLSSELKLTLLGQYKEANEGITLHSIWQTCKMQPEQTIMYLHAKGSFHDTPANQELRHRITEGAASKECFSMQKTDSCNVCGSRFSTIPFTHFPGNMWMAKCSYIQHLSNPLEFEALMENVTIRNPLSEEEWAYVAKHSNDTIPPESRKQFEGGKWNDLSAFACGAKGRFAFEHWIATHPFLKPCDVEDDRTWVAYFGKKRTREHTSYTLQEAPRFNFSVYKPGRGCHVAQGMTLRERFREYAKLYPTVNVTEEWWGYRVRGWLDYFNYPEGSPWRYSD